jgi:hypothetical protein
MYAITCYYWIPSPVNSGRDANAPWDTLYIFNGFEGPDRENHFLKRHTVEIDLIYFIFREVYTLEIC